MAEGQLEANCNLSRSSFSVESVWLSLCHAQSAVVDLKDYALSVGVTARQGENANVLVLDEKSFEKEGHKYRRHSRIQIGFRNAKTI